MVGNPSLTPLSEPVTPKLDQDISALESSGVHVDFNSIHSEGVRMEGHTLSILMVAWKPPAIL